MRDEENVAGTMYSDCLLPAGPLSRIARMKITPHIRRLVIAVFALVTLSISSFGFAQSTETDPVKLNQQIEQLRRENERLRSLLAQTQTPAPSPAQRAPAATTTVAPASQPQELTHWMTFSSSKRHNSRCRWYKNSNGRPCRADEGVACKVCGG